MKQITVSSKCKFEMSGTSIFNINWTRNLWLNANGVEEESEQVNGERENGTKFSDDVEKLSRVS